MEQRRSMEESSKRYNQNMNRKSTIDGITLVALVVTIVVLLILAGITITYVMGDNSAFKQASRAKVQTEIGKIEERAQSIYSDKLIGNASNNLKVETSEVIEKLKSEGYDIKQRVVSAGDITGISLDKENMTIGTSKTVELKVTYEGVEEPFIYYVEVQGKYYQMHSNKGFITIDREPSNLTKEDFETETGEGSTATLKVTSSKTVIATASVKAGSNNTIEVISTETEGETVVTVTYGSYTKTCNVKVVKLILATKISLNETEYVVTGGESWTNDKQLVATLEPSNVTEKGVTWKSSNPEIVTVDSNGLVKAGTKGGEVTITATTKDGSNKTAECKITSELFGKTKSAKTVYTDSDGNTAQIPDGYAVGISENVNKVTGGLVAQDNKGNQFVWIPVGAVKKNGTTAFTVTLGRYAFNTGNLITEIPVQTQDNYSDAVDIGCNGDRFQESTEFTWMTITKNSLKLFVDTAINDGGYWFGRYEASNSSETKIKYDEEAQNAVSLRNALLGAENVKTDGGYRSCLVNSYAWDTAIVFVEKSGHTGYASQSLNCGSAYRTGRSKDKVCNISDMASNWYEITSEKDSWNTSRFALRGGQWAGYGATRVRRATDSTLAELDFSFRCVLYRP